MRSQLTTLMAPAGESLIQFLRAPVKAGSIQTGRIAIATGYKGGPAANPGTERAMTAWFKTLSRWIKSNFENSFVYASDFKPEVGTRERLVWAGPSAIEMSKKGVKLKQLGPAEYSLHYFDPADEERVLARYRPPASMRTSSAGSPTRGSRVRSRNSRQRIGRACSRR